MSIQPKIWSNIFKFRALFHIWFHRNSRVFDNKFSPLSTRDVLHSSEYDYYFFALKLCKGMMFGVKSLKFFLHLAQRSKDCFGMCRYLCISVYGSLILKSLCVDECTFHWACNLIWLGLWPDACPHPYMG